MKVFITGGTGFIGSYVLNALNDAGHSVVALRYDGETPIIPLNFLPEWVDGSLEDSYKEELANCDVLLHMAAVGVNPQHATWENCFRWNVVASMNLWKTAVEAGIKKIITCGSCFEYGRSAERYDFIPTDAPLEPTGAYHSSKAAATMAALGMAVDYDLELLVLRPFHVFGEGEPMTRFWPALKKAALAGEDFEMTDGEQVRDFTPVEDIAQAICGYVRNMTVEPGHPKIINVGSGKPQTLREFAEKNWSKWGATGRLIFGAVPYRDNEVFRYVPEV